MNMIRCCLSCILPCGALDVIRIIHTNGRVEEISGKIRAEEVMKAHPKHILKKPTSRPKYDVVQALDCGPTIIVVPPDAQLQRGKIYFLIPVHDHHKKSKSSSPLINASRGSTARRKQKMISSNSISLKGANFVLANGDGDKYLSDILSEKVIYREKRRGRVAVWRPNLDSICELIVKPLQLINSFFIILRYGRESLTDPFESRDSLTALSYMGMSCRLSSLPTQILTIVCLRAGYIGYDNDGRESLIDKRSQ